VRSVYLVYIALQRRVEDALLQGGGQSLTHHPYPLHTRRCGIRRFAKGPSTYVFGIQRP
jgi:hypothetical protein